MTDSIRLATPDDVDAVQACVRAAYTMYLERMEQEPAPMTADYASLVGQGVVHVLDDDPGGDLAGLLVAFAREDHYFIENVAVRPDLHSTGRGRLLLSFAEDEAKRQGFDRIELYTNTVMTENIEYYPRLGYEETGRHEEDGFERIFFRKSLGTE